MSFSSKLDFNMPKDMFCLITLHCTQKSLHSMISSKAVSKGMAEKIAGSGLNFRHRISLSDEEKRMVLEHG